MADRTLQRMAKPGTWDAATGTCRIVVSTDRDVGDGLVLVHSKAAIRWPERPVPVVIDHVRSVDFHVGTITDLRLINHEGGRALEGDFTLGGSAADRALPLLESGAARWSVGARIHKIEQGSSRGPDRAVDWSLGHVALVIEGQDLAAVTRSFTEDTMTTEKQQTTPVIVTEEKTLDRGAERRELAIRRQGAASGLDAEVIQRIVDSDLSADDARVELIRQLRLKLEGGDRTAPSGVGVSMSNYTQLLRRAGVSVPATFEGKQGEPTDPVALAIHRAVYGKAQDVPLTEVLRAAGFTGRNGEELVRNAFTGKQSYLARGYHATGDAKALLLETGDRRLQERHSEAPRGILELARIRALADFREVSVIDAGLVGAAVKIEEGGEIRYGSLNTEAGKYKPSRYGLGMSFTFEALQNDDLGGIAQVLDEISATMLESEANALGTLLHGPGALGGTCPDGKALFHADHANKPGSAAAMDVAGLSAMVQLLRAQTSIGGRRVWLEPGYVLVGPDLETTALQLLSETWDSTTPDDANPWKQLRLIVDPNVEPTYFYLVASGSRKPFELGRVSGLPMMRQEEDFDTSGLKLKVEHGYGVSCVDFRTIVRNK